MQTDINILTNSNTEVDFIVEAATQLNKYDKKFLDFEKKSIAEKCRITKEKYENICQDTEDTMAALEEMICNSKASSIDGALAQIIMLYSSCEMCLYGANEEIKKKYLRRCHRLAYSIKDIIMNHANTLPEDFAAKRFMPDYLNPWHIE